MVSGPHSSISGLFQVPSTSQRPSSPAPHAQIPSSSPHAAVNCVETSSESSITEGIPTKFLGKSKRHSTIMNCQYKWNRYREWCKREGHMVSNPFNQKFADFLVFLRQDCHLSLNAIKDTRLCWMECLLLQGLIFPQTQSFVRSSRPAEDKFTVHLAEFLHGM